MAMTVHVAVAVVGSGRQAVLPCTRRQQDRQHLKKVHSTCRKTKQPEYDWGYDYE